MNKCRNKPTTVDNIKFHSVKESKRYLELRLLERAGKIIALELQPKFPLEINGVKICSYVGDFKYIENGKIFVEDVKGFLTPVYRLKKKLLLAVWGIEIKEI